MTKENSDFNEALLAEQEGSLLQEEELTEEYQVSGS